MKGVPCQRRVSSYVRLCHISAVANVNVLNPGQKSDMGENTCVHGVEVAVTPLASKT
jgi:hypothetical protein